MMSPRIGAAMSALPPVAAKISLVSLLLAGCAAHSGKSPQGPPPVSAAPAPASAAGVAPLHDGWRTLLPVPFGSTLQQIPFPTHEVILFHSDGPAEGDNAILVAGASAAPAATPTAGADPGTGEERECYGKSGPEFIFAGAAAEDYVLCFAHERLARVEATLRVADGEYGALFRRWCDDWLHGIILVQRAADVCEGRDGASEFIARLNPRDDRPGVSLTMTVFDISEGTKTVR